MEATIKIEKRVDLKTLEVKANVRYWEDATVNDLEDTNGDLIPCKKGEIWCPIIDLDSGIITNWKQGVKAEVHYKVCDTGSYYLKDAEGAVLLSIEGDYVPDIMCPKENGYGDYIIMNIDENGKIANWKQSLDGFIKEE
ncbi:MAG: hypothetical protein V4549_06575 [Bacteroidota bacterium]